MKLFRTKQGIYVEQDGKHYHIAAVTWDEVVEQDDPKAYLLGLIERMEPADNVDAAEVEAPIGSQEVWAAGVTYFRSRSARMEESKSAGGGSFYDRVYSAERPELFFKSQPQKVVGPWGTVGIRSDAQWSVPEPELALLADARGRIVGYTIGNDMSSRDIEGQNPLYLPQAKVYNRSCALGPGILMTREPLPESTRITIAIERAEAEEFAGETTLKQMKRKPRELAEYLFRDQDFPTGCFLLTGTGIVPPDSFTLKPGDVIRIGIDGIGMLVNTVG